VFGRFSGALAGFFWVTFITKEQNRFQPLFYFSPSVLPCFAMCGSIPSFGTLMFVPPTKPIAHSFSPFSRPYQWFFLPVFPQHFSPPFNSKKFFCSG